MKYHSLRSAIFGAVFAAMFTACGSSSNSGPASSNTAFDATNLLQNTANNIIVAVYADLKTAADDLLAAVQALEANNNDANLQAARDAWVAARIPWEKSEAFLFGPVDSQGFDPRLDSWPVNKADLDAVLAANPVFDDALIDGLDDNVRGFHTIEYLLWNDGSSDGQHTVAQVVAALQADPKRMAYLREVTEDIAQTATELSTAWHPSQGNYANTLSSAGMPGNVTYTSQRAAVQEIIQGMITIADEVGSGKLAEPFNQQDPTLVESQFSFNSRADFMDDVRGIQAVYLGDYDGNNGTGVTDYVLAVGDNATDAAVRAQIQFAIDQINEIDQPFRDSITGTPTQRQEIQNAIDAVLALRDMLQDDVLPLLDQTDFAR